MAYRRLLIAIALFTATVPGHAQSVDRILAAAAQREAARRCGVAQDGELLVCGERDAGNRYRLPLPTVRETGDTGAVAGEVPPPSVENPFLSGCGLFRGQRRCSRAEALPYGYGGGRDPVTLAGRLLTRVIDPEAEIGPPPTVPPQPR